MTDGEKRPAPAALRRATEDDLGWIVALQSRPENRRHLCAEPLEALRASLSDDDVELLIVECGRSKLGFVSLRGLKGDDGVIELKRIVADRPGRGDGGAMLAAAIRHVFQDLQARRIWLDVFADNARAAAAYRRAGFAQTPGQRPARRADGSEGELLVFALEESVWTAREGDSV